MTQGSIHPGGQRAARPRRGALPALHRRYRSRRYQYVFYLLLLTLVLNPLLPALGIDPEWLTWLVALNVLAAVSGVVRNPARKAAMLALTLAAVVISHLPETVAARWITEGALGCWVLFMGFAIGTSVRYALGDEIDVGSEHVYAALSSYVLAGFLFAIVYLALERAFPGSLGPAGASAPQPLGADGALYFSFVTLATLGYGDLVPLSGLMRGLAVLEAVAGQLYIAVLVASLISSYAQARGGARDTAAQP